MSQKNQLPDLHLRGALALIKHRGAENFRDDIDQSLFFQIRSQLVRLDALAVGGADERRSMMPSVEANR